MNKFTFAHYFQEEFFPISVTVMPAEGVLANEQLHTHEFSEIAVVTQGTFLHHTKNSTVKLKKGDFLLIHPGSAHNYSHPGNDAVLYNLLYDSTIPIPMLTACNLPLLKRIYPMNPTNDSDHYFISSLPGKTLQLVIEALDQIRHEMKKRSPGHHVLIAALFMEIAVLLARSTKEEQKEDPDWNLNQVIGFMKCRSREKIGIRELAKIAKMSERTLFRRFKETFGIGPMEYLLDMRIRHAISLLKQHDMKLETIAQECGFCDSSHLRKTLSRKFRKTPAEIREAQEKTSESSHSASASPPQPPLSRQRQKRRWVFFQPS